MAQDAVLADFLASLSPLSAAGIDPDEARLDRAGTMSKLGLLAQNDIPPQPGTSPNGNPLPSGMRSRTGTAQADEATAPTPALPDDLAAANAITIRRGQEAYGRGSEDLKKLAAQPDLSTVTEPLERQRVSAQRRQVELEKPYDPQTGKLLQEYRPNFGQRLMRGVEGFARGGVLGAVDPGMTGAQPYGAPNKYLGMDQRQAAGQVAGADQQLTQAAANWKAQNDRLKGQASEDRAQATALKDVTGASAEQQKINAAAKTAEGKEDKIPTQHDAAVIAAKLETDPVKKARLEEAVKAIQDADQRKYGAMRPPGERPSAELQRYSDLKAAAIRENSGKPLSAAQLAKVAQEASGKGGGGATTSLTPSQWQGLVNQHDKEYEAAQKAKDAELKMAFTPEDRDAVEAKYEGMAVNLQSRWDQRYAQADPEGKYAGGKSTQPAPATPAPQQAAPPPPKVGDERKGYIYQGGDPSKQSNWKPKPKAKK